MHDKKMIFTIDGVNCQGCVGKIKKSLQTHDPETLIEMNLGEKILKVDFDSSKLTGMAIKKELEALGHKVLSFKSLQ